MAAIARAIRAVSIACRRFNWQNRFGCSRGAICEWHKSQSQAIQRKNGKRAFRILAGIVGGCAVFLYSLEESVEALDNSMISLPRYPWEFKSVFKSFDHAALRRGWVVYRTVCHTCHSLRYVRFLDLVNVSHTTEEAQAIAAEFEVEDGPDDEGNYYERPGKLTDSVPDPYPNEQAARVANSGAYPPDLTQVVHARKRGIDYLFSLLTGWIEPPAGVHLADGQYFNPYFPGGITMMAQMFFPGAIEYDDGTPATESQMAKDVVEFLSWTAAPEHDSRKIMTLKCIGICALLVVAIAHVNRRNFSHLRSQRIAYVPKRSC